ncbi:pali-domain-containing protein [Sistotremastrum niveocremeum HHB9708]|uniref:Pali-domain-containing protein n=1 Tax=Sistotremastrum niveocremeum HHB9708 TaxID=1314777 RepID=A0A164WX16_9AGAM|nr:pali-domain-containing protein [Sistotremastrum niveocremeum HHB9708]
MSGLYGSAFTVEFVALVLIVLASISLPVFDGFRSASVANTAFFNPSGEEISSIRFGVWGYCNFNQLGNATCFDKRPYSLVINATANHKTSSFTIPTSRTGPLIMHVVAAAFTVVALLSIIFARISIKRFAQVIAALTSILAMIMAIVALVIDILFFSHVQHGIDKITDLTKTTLGIGSWLTLAASVFLVIGTLELIANSRRQNTYVVPVAARPASLVYHQEVIHTRAVQVY